MNARPQIIDAARVTRTPIHLMRDGTALQIGDLRLNSERRETRFRRAAGEQRVDRAPTRRGRAPFLLTGDIERRPSSISTTTTSLADVLKVAHHGSRSSTSQALCSTRSRRESRDLLRPPHLFGHPHATVLESWRTAQSDTVARDRDGTVASRWRDDACTSARDSTRVMRSRHVQYDAASPRALDVASSYWRCTSSPRAIPTSRGSELIPMKCCSRRLVVAAR